MNNNNIDGRAIENYQAMSNLPENYPIQNELNNRQQILQQSSNLIREATNIQRRS